jgi:cytochrome c2
MHRATTTWSTVLILLIGGWLMMNPRRFWLNLIKPVEPTAATGSQLVEKYQCRECHRIDRTGALNAPSLDDIAKRDAGTEQSRLQAWLRNPKAVKGNTAMPNFHLSDSEIEALIAYLSIDKSK